MNTLNEYHFKAWFLKSRHRLLDFRQQLPALTPAQQLDFIRQEYPKLALIRKVTRGDAEFTGTPARTLTLEGK